MMRHPEAITRATLLGVFAALVGCTDAGSPIFILQNQVPDEGCSISASVGGTFNPRGRIDTNAGAGYLFTPVIQNVAESGTGSQGMVFIEGADVELTLQKGLFGDNEDAVYAEDTFQVLTKFSKQFSGTVMPNNGTTSFGFTIIPEDLLTEYIADRLADDGSQITEVRADVSIYGNMNGGGVSTPTFSYWVDVCNGCMKQNVGACADLPDGYQALAGGPCVLLQDVPLQCCTAADSSEVCPAAAPAL